MKPIEPGCLALAAPCRFVYRSGKKSQFPAHIVSVLGFKGAPVIIPFCGRCGRDDSYWFVSSDLLNAVSKVSAMCACKLTRIDGGDPDAIIETEKEFEKCD